jgi:hypothetical protein
MVHAAKPPTAANANTENTNSTIKRDRIRKRASQVMVYPYSRTSYCKYSMTAQ